MTHQQATVEQCVHELLRLSNAGVDQHEASISSALVQLSSVPMTRQLLQSTKVGKFINTELRPKLRKNTPIARAVDALIEKWRNVASTTSSAVTTSVKSDADGQLSDNEFESSSIDVPKLTTLCMQIIEKHVFKMDQLPPLLELRSLVQKIANECVSAEQLNQLKRIANDEVFAPMLEQGWKRMMELRPDMQNGLSAVLKPDHMTWAQFYEYKLQESVDRSEQTRQKLKLLKDKLESEKRQVKVTVPKVAVAAPVAVSTHKRSALIDEADKDNAKRFSFISLFIIKVSQLKVRFYSQKLFAHKR